MAGGAEWCGRRGWREGSRMVPHRTHIRAGQERRRDSDRWGADLDRGAGAEPEMWTRAGGRWQCRGDLAGPVGWGPKAKALECVFVVWPLL